MKQKWLWPTVIVLAAAALRIPGLFTDFWGDEIWSWQIAGKLHSISDILLSTTARIDNNHPLNTLWLYLLGPNQPEWLYRLPALLAGVGTVAVAMHCMARRGRIAGLAAGGLTAVQFPLLFYSSEARGYALAVFFGVVAFDALEVALAGGGWRSRLTFAVAASLGFLAHLTFLHVYAAAFVWSVIKLRGRWRPLLHLHALPSAVAAMLSIVFVKHMTIGGALPRNPGDVITETLSLTLGGPADSLLIATAATTLFTLALLFHRERTGAWIFFLVVVAISPAMTTLHELLLGEHPQPLMLRYFIVCMPFYMFAFCPLIQLGWQSGTAWRTLTTAAVLLFITGNGMHYIRFLRDGRGHPSEALAHIAQATPSGPLNIASDPMWRTQLLLAFYAQRMYPTRAIDLSETTGDWVILNRKHATEADHAIDFHGKHFLLDSTYRESELSGWSWFVYRLEQ